MEVGLMQILSKHTKRILARYNFVGILMKIMLPWPN